MAISTAITIRLFPVTLAMILALSAAAGAQENDHSAAQANNPLADMTAFNMQNY